MKKLQTLLFYALLLTMGSSCNNDNDTIWDFVNYSIEFTVDNEDILNDKEFLSKIRIIYNGKEYAYSEENNENFHTKATYCYPLAIRCYNQNYDKDKTIRVLGFGEFRPNNNYKNQKFTIDWGNGRTDEIRFDIYITWKKGDPTVHKRRKLNGEKKDFAPLHIPL